MVTFVDGPVRASVPATSANLGPGFDSLGLALSLRDELEAEVIGSGLVVEVDGAGSDSVPLDESHLVVRSMRAAFAAMDAEPPGLRLGVHERRTPRPRPRLVVGRDRGRADAWPGVWSPVVGFCSTTRPCSSSPPRSRATRTTWRRPSSAAS